MRCAGSTCLLHLCWQQRHPQVNPRTRLNKIAFVVLVHVKRQTAFECDFSVIRSAHVSRSRAQQAAASRGRWWICAAPPSSVREQILGCSGLYILARQQRSPCRGAVLEGVVPVQHDSVGSERIEGRRPNLRVPPPNIVPAEVIYGRGEGGERRERYYYGWKERCVQG